MKTIWIAAVLMFNAAALQAQFDFEEINIFNNDNFTGFELLDSEVQNKRLVMTGENHSFVKYNAKMELKMLRYLNQTNGTRNFIIELGPARAHYLNRFINETDTMADRYLKATTSPRYMELFRRLRAFNRSRPDSLKIRVYGIDVERFNDLALIRLAELFPKGIVPEKIRPLAEAIQGTADFIVRAGVSDYDEARDETRSGYFYRTSAPYSIDGTIREFLTGYDSLKVDFQSWFGADSSAITDAIEWLREYKTWEDYENTTYQYIWREENIYRNLSALLSNMPGERFYGQFGRCHVSYSEQNGDCGWFGYHSVVNKIRQRYFHSYDSVLTIGIFYGEFQEYNYLGDGADEKKLKKEVEKLFDMAPSRVSTLYRLSNEEDKYPALSEKFSYVIVNNEKDLTDDDDTVATDIITKADKGRKNSPEYFFYTYQYTHTSVNTDVLGNHISSAGFSTTLPALAFHELVFGMNTGEISQDFRFAATNRVKLHDGDSGALRYGAVQFTYRVSYPLLNKPHIFMGAGAMAGYASEAVRYQNKDVPFLQPRFDKTFVHRAMVAGPALNVGFRIGSWMYAGIQGAYVFSALGEQWRYKGSSQPYGQPGKVSSGFRGTYISASIGFYLNAEQNEYSEWD